MHRQLLRFLRDESGFVSGPEWAFLATILVLAAITGVVATRQAQLQDVHPLIVPHSANR